MPNQVTHDRIASLRERYLALSEAMPEAITQFALAEIPEMVYNSNAIENSTLTLQDTEDILLRDAISRDHDVREIFEAKNLARITEFLLANPNLPLTSQLILDLHAMLLGGIRDDWAGRFRHGKEWVRVGAHVGANPDFVSGLVSGLIADYHERMAQTPDDFVAAIGWFHAEFEIIHPFNDGNGRLGRVLINHQLALLNLPPIIVPNKGKRTAYYPLFDAYRVSAKSDGFTELVGSLLIEALHRRIALLTAPKLITVSAWAKQHGIAGNSAINKATRGTIPAFRLRGKWMIAADHAPHALNARVRSTSPDARA
ncbi:MAG TPA: Fic family protein [Candidatus Lumbricidophila sp.]|nr:Fic family protein [Candidatus Lumbricidophila sp.]